MNNTNKMVYFTEVKNRILCTEYSGPNLEQKQKYEVVDKFPVEHKVVKIAKNKEGKIYILLSNGLVLVFKNFDVLNNKLFKKLENAIIGAYIKYCLKRVGNNVNFQIRKALNKNKRCSLNSAMSVILAGVLSLSHVSTEKYQATSQYVEAHLNNQIKQMPLVDEENSYEASLFVEDTSFLEPSEEINIEPVYEEESSISYDQFTSGYQIANNNDFYSGKVYDDLVSVMNDSQKTAEMNSKIQEYISQNLNGQMWANAENQGYNNYTIPEKYKNGKYTLNELFDDASSTFGVPKDVLVSISQHECGQGYYPLNSYTQNYEQNCGGMMGIVDLYGISSSHLPGGTTAGLDVRTNPAISIYAYASTIRFFYDNFKDINIGNGLDSWDIAVAMIAIGPGHVTDISVGFNYRQDYEDLGWSQLNICAPQFKALREAYLNNKLGVNDLTLTVENGVVTHWSDGELFYYKNGEKNFNKMNNSVQPLPRS